MEAHDQAVLEALDPLKEAGFALHWLHPRTKRPIGERWSEAPVASLEDLRRTHSPGNNLGARPGQWSPMAAGGYLHIFDIDIRIRELAEEAWERFGELFPDVAVDTLPTVASGSGGESRHLYIITDKPFWSKKLAVSEGKHRGADGKWHYDWEIELFGSNKQVALPPSIHPDTGQPYRWLLPFDFDMLALGVGPIIPSAAIERLAIAEAATYEFETRDPLTFEPGQLERDLDDIPLEHIDDYHEWIILGQALHHQFGAAAEGFDLWVEHSKRSEKFDGTHQGMRTMRSKWRGFGRNRRQPVTMATVRQWALDARRARLIAQFDEEPEDAFDEGDAPAGAAAPAVDVIDLLGDDSPDVEDEADEVDPIDAIGTGVAAEGSVVPEHAKAWMDLLQFTEKGAISGTLHNVKVIVRNDPRLIGVPQINEFTQETVQRNTPGRQAPRRRNAAKPMLQLEGRVWHVEDPLNGDLWSEDRDFAVRAVLEAPTTQGGYGFKVTDRDLKAAIALSANEHPFHPIREYLNGLIWDKKPRVETLFIDHVGALNDDMHRDYHRAVGRLVLVAAVTRIFEPGHKFDFAAILEGVQGRGKSSFIQALGKHWFAELDGDFHDQKQMVELMQGAWIMEIPELSGMARADVRAIKAFMSRQKDRVRLAYARRAGSFPRQVVFIGSTNDREYLKDDTGGRRFWPVVCKPREIDIIGLEREVDQLWAEAVVLYREMRAKQPHGRLPLFLRDAGVREAALRLQESRRVETAVDGLAGRIGALLDRPVNNGGFDDEPDGDRGKVRNVTCLMQIWVDLGNDIRNYDNAKAQQLGIAMNKVPGWTSGRLVTFEQPYGRQRAYFRDSADPLAALGL